MLFKDLLQLALRLALATALVLPSAVARADDLADEADLKFQLGAEAYQRGDYRGALEHFLASNRLVPNKNVIFNIARSYEKLGSFPEAFRYYSQALEAETDTAAAGKIRTALDQLRANVAVINVVTDPPGATLYVNRKDLGPRGNAPRALGLARGRYTIIAELAGYEPARAEVPDARVGTETRLVLELKPILGNVKLPAPQGASVRVDDPTATPACRIPCTVPLAPGRHTLFLEKPGFARTELSVDVTAHRTIEPAVTMASLTGNLVVSTDETGALIEVDDRPRGFTPAIIPLTVGEHRVRISLKGFRDIERTVTIAEDEQSRLDVLLTQSEEVIAASRVPQKVEQAPSSVTIVPRLEIDALRYPTIAEAARGVRGFYVWDDRSYVTLGVRGLGRLGSYGNRLLVLYDGHPANDNWLGSSYVGYDGLTDLGDVERIEFIRGPGSVLYGTSAFSGVINVVTRDRDVPQGAEVGVGTELDGVARARARGDVKLSEDSGIWTSVSGARGEGRDFFFPEFVADTSPGVEGYARDVDDFRAGTVHGRVYSGIFSLQWFGHIHEKHLPTGEFETLLGDRRTRQTDTRLFVEGKAEPELLDGLKLLTRVHLNHYRFEGHYARDPVDGGVELDTFRGAWAGLEERVTWTPQESLRVIAGAEGQLHFQVEQRARDDAGYFLDDSGENQRRYQLGAGYLVTDIAVTDDLDLSAGARLDIYSTFGYSVNPRAAVIVRAYDGGNTKLIVGKAFRAPSVYELFYNDDGFTQIPNHELRPESVYSAEVEHGHKFSPTVTGLVAGYTNYVTKVIITEGSGDQVDPIQYVNSDSPLFTTGAEVALRRDWRQGWMISASYGLSHARYLASTGISDLLTLEHDRTKRDVENAPMHLATLKGAVPIISRALSAGTRITFEGEREDRFENRDDPEPQNETDPAVIWDIVLSGEERRFGLRYAFGVYNAFDWRYAVPVSAEFRQRTIEQAGRTFLASADLSF